MALDDKLAFETDPNLDQYFLVNQDKIGTIIHSAGITPSDRVVEIGAGVGTVAEHVPTCRSLTTIEYDTRLIGLLKDRVPHAHVIQGDALAILATITGDVLISNLPGRLTPSLVTLLPTLSFRVALLTVPTFDALTELAASFALESVTILNPSDFYPLQASSVEVVRVRQQGENRYESTTR